MSTNKTLTTLGVLLALVIGIFLGHEFWAKQGVVAGAISAVGTYQSGIRADYQSINTATAATTTGSFAIYNASNDRVITDGFAFCSLVAAETQSAGVWKLTAATSSVATTSSVAYALNITLATTSANLLVSSSTSGVTGSGIQADQYIWPANTYLVFSFNATDTATCTAGVRSIQL